MSKRIYVKLATAKGFEPATVRATRPTRASVLVVHRHISPGRNGWGVTHTPTGRGLGLSFKTRAQALTLAHEFGEREEWALIGPRGGISKVPREFAQELNNEALRIATNGASEFWAKLSKVGGAV